MAGARRAAENCTGKHFTRDELDARLDAEVRVAPPKRAKPPKWLPESLKSEFRTIGKRLISAGLYADLDADTLGRYLMAQHQYLLATQEAEKALSRRGVGGAADPDMDAADLAGRVQERYFKQCRNCANDLGLTISARCRLVIPQGLAHGAGGDEPDDEFTKALRARQAAAMAASE